MARKRTTRRRRVTTAIEVANQMLTVEEVAKRLRISKWSVYQMVAAKKAPPALRVGRALRFDAAALERWIQEQSHTPQR